MTRKQDEQMFVQILSTKLRESNTNNNIIVAHTAEAVAVDSEQTELKVDLDVFGGVPTVAKIKLTHWGREALRGEAAGKKVLIGSFGNFYAIIDVIL
ncbi:hypothetical protein [Bacillus mycoides]|uniref:hypothetical protein n=1 Tax=Bacillus mycoides TaxID=1405 RepID=UPI001C00C6DE|nr:hypothetical protein [Bacillus mycoides]QWI55264.1 hypothetical protein EXW42_14260 [Bacillus mycoides]QWI91868.1 hypothetical protein J5W00_10390 [Bacillus mycoides]